MKRGELEKRQGSKLTNQMRAAGNAYGRAIAPEPDRRAQRDRDRALGLFRLQSSYRRNWSRRCRSRRPRKASA
jgi:hypothetical protein